MKNDYQVFISFKNTEEDKDRQIANKIYEHLKKHGLKVFFSDVTLAKDGIDNWNDEIYNNAIEVSKVFISVGTKRAYMEMKHTEGERRAFLTEKKYDNSKVIYSYIGGNMTHDNLPHELNSFECFQDKEENPLDRLLEKIQNHLAKYLSTLNYTSIKNRKKEIEDYIFKYNNFDYATKKLMHFATDFTDIQRRIKKANAIRVKYNNYQEKKELIEIQEEILDLMLDIEDEYNSKREVIQKAYESIDNNIVFKGSQVTKIYKKKSIDFSLKPIGLTLKYGEITAVVGGNGNGKTTLFNIIAGELLHSSGEIGYPALTTKKSDWYSIKTQIAYIKQELSPWQGLVKDNLHFTAGINGIKGQNNIDAVDDIILKLGLEKYEDARWNELSGGFKMRFALARAMLKTPKLLILDEPLANLDPNTQNIFLEDLITLSRSPKNKMSIIISSQHIPQIEAIAKNTIFLKDGKVTYNGLTKDLGKEREENVYEYEFEKTIEEYELEKILRTKIDCKIKKDGYSYIIRTELSVDSNMLFKIFSTNNIEVKSFRNISQSTKKFFGEKNG